MKKAPQWKNPPLIVYHGCDDVAAHAICTAQGRQPNGIDLKLCSPQTDFGRGFYTTTFLHQAKNWANARYKRRSKVAASAAIVKFQIDREALSHLEDIAFVWEGAPNVSNFWSLVRHCRGGNDHSHPSRKPAFYDVVYGPVALPNQTLVIKDCDQISFHSKAAISILMTPTPDFPKGKRKVF